MDEDPPDWAHSKYVVLTVNGNRFVPGLIQNGRFVHIAVHAGC